MVYLKNKDNYDLFLKYIFEWRIFNEIVEYRDLYKKQKTNNNYFLKILFFYSKYFIS